MLKNIKRRYQVIKRKLLSKHLLLVRTGVFVSLALLIFLLALGAKTIFSKTTAGQYVRIIGNFLFLPKGVVESYGGRVNVLLLGLSGDGVKNPVLSDTIILLSIGEKEKNARMISVPRDIWIGELNDKINSAYFYGNQKAFGGGLVLAKSSAEKVLGVPIQYVIAVNFDGFVEVVDILGGVEVDVERTFSDSRYPISGREDDPCGEDTEFGCRYETVTFNSGRQIMDGATALKFSRSRHSEDPDEGNDLARAARQQKVLMAIKDKMLSPEIYRSPGAMLKLWNKFWQITETSLNREQLAYVVRILYNAKDSVSSHKIPEDMLFNPPYSDEYRKLYVFIPSRGDWSGVHDWVEGVLAGTFD